MPPHVGFSNNWMIETKLYCFENRKSQTGPSSAKCNRIWLLGDDANKKCALCPTFRSLISLLHFLFFLRFFPDLHLFSPTQTKKLFHFHVFQPLHKGKNVLPTRLLGPKRLFWTLRVLILAKSSARLRNASCLHWFVWLVFFYSTSFWWPWIKYYTS